jgi:hypothetical protein
MARNGACESQSPRIFAGPTGMGQVMESKIVGLRMRDASSGEAALRAVSLAVRLRHLECRVIPAGRCPDGSYLIVLTGPDVSDRLYKGLPVSKIVESETDLQSTAA